MILDEVDPAIRANLESRSWLSLLEIDHPPPTALIREFFSNLSCQIYDSNTSHVSLLELVLKTMYLSCFRSAQSWFFVVKLE